MRYLRFTARHADVIEQRSLEARPLEYCGVLLGRVEQDTGVVEHIVGVRNADRRPHRFSVPAAEWRRAGQIAAEAELAVIGLLHSHTTGSAALSPKDRAALEYSTVPWIIAGVEACGRASLAAFRPGSCETIIVLIDEQPGDESIVHHDLGDGS